MNSFVLAAFFAIFAAASASVLPATPIIAYSSPVLSTYSAPLLGAGLASEQTVVAGPSGTISTGRTLAAPALTGYEYGTPLLHSYGAPVIAARTIL